MYYRERIGIGTLVPPQGFQQMKLMILLWTTLTRLKQVTIYLAYFIEKLISRNFESEL